MTAEWTSILDLFPAYSDMFRETQATLTTGAGPLSLLERRFIALMVSSLTEAPSVPKRNSIPYLKEIPFRT